MARLYSSGFELQSLTSAVEWQVKTGSPTINTTTKNPNGGAASMRCNTTAATAFVYNTFQADTVNTHYERFYIYIATLPSALCAVWQYRDSVNGVGDSLRVDTSGNMGFYNDSGTGVVTGATASVSTGAWHKVELKFVDDAASAAVFEWYFDGVLVATNTGQVGINGGGRSALGVITAVTTDMYFDDYAVNDSSGSAQNSYPGSGRIAHLYPITAGDNAQWTPLASTNWSNVDEAPTPDDVTSYNSVSAAGTFIDDFGLQTPGSANILAGATIACVQIGVRGGSTATTAGANMTARIKSAAGGTVATGAADTYNLNGWRTNGTTPYAYGLTSYTDPTTGVAWTVSGTNSLTNMQAGYTNSASNTTVRRVTSVWALVDFMPAASAVPTNLFFF